MNTHLEKHTFIIIATLAVGALLGAFVALLFTTHSPHHHHHAGGYQIKDGTVYFFDHEVYGADPATFTALKYDYATDQDHVYYDGRIVPGADPRTFQVVGYLMAKDQRNVFTFDRPERAIDVEKFRFLGNFYSRVEDTIFYKGRVTEADAETFTVLPNHESGMDATQYFHRGNVRRSTEIEPEVE